MREETSRSSSGSSEINSIEEQSSLRFRVEYQSGQLIVFVANVSTLYDAWSLMESYDPEGLFDLRVVDNETDEIVPHIMMAWAGINLRNKKRWAQEESKVDWAKEGF